MIPNHACPVSNLTNRVIFQSAADAVRSAEVAARGLRDLTPCNRQHPYCLARLIPV